MTREDIIKLINISEELVEEGRGNRPGFKLTPKKITIHNTSNANPGANAAAHSKFIRNTGYYQIGGGEGPPVSWHYTVDDKQSIRQLPENEVAYHALSTANASSLAIEVCMHKEINQAAANERAAQLTALLCFDYSLGTDAVVTHKHWTGKNCPVLLLVNWTDFIKRVEYFINKLKVSTSNVLLVGEKHLEAVESEFKLCWDEPTDLLDFNEFSSDKPPVQNSFNLTFLGGIRIELPVFLTNNPISALHSFIHHQNLTIYFNSHRKLSLYSACNFDRSRYIDMGRSNNFRADAIDADKQTGQGFYYSLANDKAEGQNYFDRGHLISRQYNQWGNNSEEARRGERDTYYFTTIHPQVGELNQKDWEKLEAFVIKSRKLSIERVSIIAGAVLNSKDPIADYIDAFTKEVKSLSIPEYYWKVIYYVVEGELRKIAFLMSQKDIVANLPMIRKEPVELIEAHDPFANLDENLKPYIVKNSIIETMIGLSFFPAKELYNGVTPLKVTGMEKKFADPGVLEEEQEVNFWQFI